MSTAKAVVAAVGHDRPGLVSEITRLAEQHALNIEDSRMTVLGGEFALLMCLVGTDHEIAAFRASAQALENDALSLIFRETTERAVAEDAVRGRVTVSAMDHPGIVAAVASFFSERAVNIYDLETSTTPAPHTGTPIFDVVMTIELPPATDADALSTAFSDFCAGQDLDGALLL